MKSIKIKDLTWDPSIYPRTAKTQQTINTWISDIRARQKINRNSTIIRLSRLGWTQEKIADITGMTQGRVAQIINSTFGVGFF
jgi:AraC-like DNA-binding protein